MWYYASTGQIDQAVQWLERLFALNPVAAMAMDQGLERGLFGRGLDLEGGRFPATLERLRREAWERIVRESRSVQLP